MVVFSPLLVKFATPLGVVFLYLLQLLVGPELGGTPVWWKFTLLKGFFPICGCAAFCFGMFLRRAGFGTEGQALGAKSGDEKWENRSNLFSHSGSSEGQAPLPQ